MKTTFPTISLGLLALACGSPPASVNDAGPNDGDGGPATPGSDGGLDAATADAGTPDIALFMDRTRIDLAIEERNFAADACELDPIESCIDASGTRRLLRFSVETPNIGEGDLFVGPPDESNPNFDYSPCHDHFHFLGYAEFRLLDAGGQEVVAANKQAFCVVDSTRFDDDDPTVSAVPKYTCSYQGLQRGWSDIYNSELPCQFLDVTDLPDGNYSLVIEVNTAGTLPELSTDNNLETLALTLGDTDLETPTEACPSDADAHATRTTNRECGWSKGPSLLCTPGELVRVGCASACSLGSCTGDAILRVCDSNRPDGNCSFAAALGRGDNNCQSSCPRTDVFTCPASGSVDVYTAAKSPDASATCTAALQVFE